MSKNINLTLRAANSWKSRDACKLSNKVTFFTISVLSVDSDFAVCQVVHTQCRDPPTA